MRPADLHCVVKAGIVCATLTGEIDMSNAEALRGAMAAATPNDALGLVVDLSAVDYLDSAGIHMIYRLREGLRMRGQGLRLVIPGDSTINDTLRLAGLGRSADVADSVAEATRALLPDQTNLASHNEG